MDDEVEAESIMEVGSKTQGAEAAGSSTLAAVEVVEDRSQDRTGSEDQSARWTGSADQHPG